MSKLDLHVVGFSLLEQQDGVRSVVKALIVNRLALYNTCTFNFSYFPYTREGILFLPKQHRVSGEIGIGANRGEICEVGTAR